MSHKLIMVAATYDEARAAAISWLWEPAGRDIFRTADGQIVRYVHDREGNFLAYPRGTQVFIGPGAWRRKDQKQMWEMIESGRFALVAS